MKEKVEHIIFKNEEDEIHVVGFILKENKKTLTLSLTKSYGDHVDIQTIQKSDILTRNIIT